MFLCALHTCAYNKKKRSIYLSFSLITYTHQRRQKEENFVSLLLFWNGEGKLKRLYKIFIFVLLSIRNIVWSNLLYASVRTKFLCDLFSQFCVCVYAVVIVASAIVHTFHVLDFIALNRLFSVCIVDVYNFIPLCLICCISLCNLNPLACLLCPFQNMENIVFRLYVQ